MNLRKKHPFDHSARVATVQKLVTFLAGPNKVGLQRATQSEVKSGNNLGIRQNGGRYEA
jgi:hypothetical protein